MWPGFGRISYNGPPSSELLHVNVDYVKQDECNRNWGGRITTNMMCAADDNGSACRGDSGGPLLDRDNDTLVGVVSWGPAQCLVDGLPVVYSRISSQVRQHDLFLLSFSLCMKIDQHLSHVCTYPHTYLLDIMDQKHHMRRT